MVNITINDKNYSVKENTSVLEACKENGIFIPTLCYLKDINEIGACKICLIEIEGVNDLVSACNTKVSEGLVIRTDSERVEKTRRMNLELILSEHNYDCDNCSKDGKCLLQKLVDKYNIDPYAYQNKFKEKSWNNDYSFIRDNSKCIKCMRCINICDKVQGLNVWDLKNNGTRTSVDMTKAKDIINTKCVSCGQCVSHCPTAALIERDDSNKLLNAINDKDKIVVAQIAPAVRTAILDSKNKNVSIKQIASALKKLGVDYVTDTSFAADVTIFEEGNEFVERLEETKEFPMFTSCCPGWVSFVKKEYPELIKHLSTTKSPQQIQGSIIKTYFAEKMGIDKNKICSISIMPCIAKKLEKDLDGNESNKGIKDVDLVLSSRELIKLINKNNINIDSIEEVELDNPISTYTGSATLFGTSGGVMEAALRYLAYKLTGNSTNQSFYKDLDVFEEWKEKEIDLNGTKVKIAVVSGLANTRKLIEALKEKRVSYNFVEVMSCPGGCVNGGGQPVDENAPIVNRSNVLYRIDDMAEMKSSHANDDVNMIYDNYFDKPMSKKAHEYFHTNHQQ